MARVLSVLAGGVLAVLGAGAVLFLMQRDLLYEPRPGSPALEAPMLFLSVEGERIAVNHRAREGARAVVYFAGNGEDVSRVLPVLAPVFPEHAQYLLHYRGYGGSTGKPSEAALFADGLAVFDRAFAEHPEVTVIGRSLGSGVATYVASRRPVQRLVLVTPFDSIEAVVQGHRPYLPLRWLMLDKYRSWSYAGDVRAPTTVIAAERDDLVPRERTEALFRHFAPGIAHWVDLPGTNHDNIVDSPAYGAALTLAR